MYLNLRKSTLLLLGSRTPSWKLVNFSFNKTKTNHQRHQKTKMIACLYQNMNMLQAHGIFSCKFEYKVTFKILAR